MYSEDNFSKLQYEKPPENRNGTLQRCFLVFQNNNFVLNQKIIIEIVGLYPNMKQVFGIVQNHLKSERGK